MKLSDTTLATLIVLGLWLSPLLWNGVDQAITCHREVVRYGVPLTCACGAPGCVDGTEGGHR